MSCCQHPPTVSDPAASWQCGGCQWQHIAYEYQLEAKQNQVIQALERIGGFNCPPVAPVLAVPPVWAIATNHYPLGISATGQVQAGYYQKEATS